MELSSQVYVVSDYIQEHLFFNFHVFCIEIYLKINEIRDKIVDILIEKYCNTFENIAIYSDTKISPNTQPYQ